MVKYDMTCVKPPFDIQTDGATKCSLKCLLHYKYGDSACMISNSNSYLAVQYDGVSDVVFNNVKYDPKAILIYKPSLHKYAGKPAVAELLILHTSSQGLMYICIPITVDTKLTRGSYLLKDIISVAPTSGGSASPSIADFNANYFIPSSRYYTYQAVGLGSSCNGQQAQFVVFHPDYGSLSITKETFAVLDKLVQPSYIETSRGAVSVNMTGTTTNGFAGDGQIYIDCQPTGVSEEEVVFKEPSSVPGGAPNESLMTLLLIVIGAALIYGTFMVMKFVLNSVGKSSSAKPLVAIKK